MTFTIQLADVSVEISCQHENNRGFFQDYLTNAKPELRIEPSEEDLIRAEQQLKDAAVQEGKNAEFLPWRVENNAIHYLMADALTDHGVLLVHGSAIVMDGETYVFIADSGTGKSTHARLWREAFGDRAWMVNDDKPMLRLAENKILVYGTPWNGKHHLGCNRSAPLKALVQLNRSKTNKVEPLSKTEALMMLIRHSFRPSCEAKLKKVLCLEADIIERAAAFRLACNMEPEAALAAWKGMQKPH